MLFYGGPSVLRGFLCAIFGRENSIISAGGVIFFFERFIIRAMLERTVVRIAGHVSVHRVPPNRSRW